MVELEKLMEKKDLVIYLDLRVKEIERDYNRNISIVTKEKRAYMAQRIVGMTNELLKLKHII